MSRKETQLKNQIIKKRSNQWHLLRCYVIRLEKLEINVILINGREMKLTLIGKITEYKQDDVHHAATKRLSTRAKTEKVSLCYERCRENEARPLRSYH